MDGVVHAVTRTGGVTFATALNDEATFAAAVWGVELPLRFALPPPLPFIATAPATAPRATTITAAIDATVMILALRPPPSQVDAYDRVEALGRSSRSSSGSSAAARSVSSPRPRCSQPGP